METEIWPNLLYSLRKKGSKIVLANGRISDRSFPRYMKIQPFVAKILELIDMFLMASETDKDRIFRMGAPVNRIRVVGNTKFDAALRSVSKDVEKQARSILNLKESDKVWIAGSTHPGEHEIVLDCFQRLVKIYPELVLIIAPRHTETISSILLAINERGFETPFMRSSFDSGQRRQSQNIVVLDTTGELLKFYSVASVVFVGGSLVPKGGQNILEPIAWGKKVLFGPSMEDFRDARDLLLKVGAAVETSNGEELFDLVAESLNDMKHSAAMGRLGLEELAGHSGSAKTVARMLFNIISPEGKA
jgi:3-deoxy-D-manno-octulosonic-acid transferase